MGLGPGCAGELARNLPYGDQRRLEIARALATRPKLLCLDEPAAGFNPAEKAELMELIRKIRDQGYTVLLIEHDMRLVMGVTDRIVVLEFGRKIAEGLPAEIASMMTMLTIWSMRLVEPDAVEDGEIGIIRSWSGIISVARTSRNRTPRPGNRRRAKAYPAKLPRTTLVIVTAMAITKLLKNIWTMFGCRLLSA